MTESFPHGHPRADASSPGKQGNGARSDRYSSTDSDGPAEEFVTAPGHGAVGVFQAPQPVRPRSTPVDNTLDIDSPFLDLFGGTPVPSGSGSGGSGSGGSMAAPEVDADLDFGFEFEEPVAGGSPSDAGGPPSRPTFEVPPAPVSAAPASSPPGSRCGSTIRSG